MQSASQWFRASREDIGKVTASIGIPCGHGNIIGKTAWAVQTNPLPALTKIHMTFATSEARTAVHAGVYDNVIANLEIADSGTNLDQTTCHFVTGYKRIRQLSYPRFDFFQM
jgi:hypothetical protein